MNSATLTAQDVWLSALGTIQMQVSSNTYNLYFRDSKCMGYQDGVLTIQTRMQSFADELTAKYLEMCQKIVQKVWRQEVAIAFTAQPSNGAIHIPKAAVNEADEIKQLRAQLRAANQKITALESDVEQLRDTVAMYQLFEVGGIPTPVLKPGEVVINLLALREIVASLRPNHHGCQALFELIARVDPATRKTKMSAAEIGEAIGLKTRTSYDRLIGDALPRDGKSVDLSKIVVPYTTFIDLENTNVVTYTTNLETTEATGSEVDAENVVYETTPLENTPENVVYETTNGPLYDMNDKKEKLSSENHSSFMPPAPDEKQPPLQWRPVIFWLSREIGWNWREWGKIEWEVRPVQEWIAVGLHCLKKGTNPAGLFVTMVTQNQKPNEEFMGKATDVKLPAPEIIIQRRRLQKAS